MGYTHLTLTSQISQAVTVVTCLICIILPYTTAYTIEEREVLPAIDELSKRDVFMGLKMQCQSHPRNCPDHFIKRHRLIESLLKRAEEPPASEQRLRAEGILAAGDGINRSLGYLGSRFFKQLLNDFRTPDVDLPKRRFSYQW